MLATHTLLTNFLDNAATVGGDRPAICDEWRNLDYAGLRDAATRIADFLQLHGVNAGDRVILCMPNSVAFCAAFWGILAAGGVAVPINPETKAGKLAFIIGNCSPSALIADPKVGATMRIACDKAKHWPLLIEGGNDGTTGMLDELIDSGVGSEAFPVPKVIDQDIAVIIYTSGSTGEPKGVMLSHLNITSAARSVAQYLGYSSDDRIFCAIPMTFDYGLHQLTMAALTGASVLAETSFARPFFALQKLAASKATVFPIVPTMVPLIAPLADRFDLGALRIITSTAAALHAEFIDRLRSMCPAATVFSMYGLTECHRCTYLPPAMLDIRKTSVGVAIPNTEMWVVDGNGKAHHHSATGELVIRGSTVMKGYWKNAEATAKRLRPGPKSGEMVLYTGDTCRLDDEGYLYFVSRSDDILKVRGEKVVPTEVGAILVGHPEVSEACVMGETHPVHGEVCIAFVSLSGKVDAAALTNWCRDRLDPHAVPASISILGELPRTQNGKIDRISLRGTGGRKPHGEQTSPTPVI